MRSREAATGLALLLLAGCTSAHRESAATVSPTVSTVASGPCATHFANVRAQQVVSLGELRSEGPQTTNQPSLYRGLPDQTQVRECLVPVPTAFAVYLIYPDGQTQRFSTQNVPDRILPVS